MSLLNDDTLTTTIIAASEAVRRPVIFDTDWMGDVDDALAVRLLCHAERIGLVDVRAAVLDTRAHKGPGSLDAAFTYEGHPDLPVGVIPTFTTASGTPSTYVGTYFDGYPHKEGWAPAAASAVDTYRRTLAAEDDASVDIISVGMLTALHQLLLSPADSISSLTGLQLVEAKVRHLWVMGGQYPLGNEWNFQQDVAATTYVIANWPAAVPATFSGYEVGATVALGANLAHLTAVDPVAKALSDYGSLPAGRAGWDPMAVWLACLGDPTAAGYDTVQGTVTIDGVGGNNFTVGGGGPHRYVRKLNQDRWYQQDLNARLLPGADPAPADGAGLPRPAPVLYEPSTATTRPVRNAAADLLVQHHADDLAAVPLGTAVAHLDDRQLGAPARQLTSAARPTLQVVAEARCLQFASGQWLASDMLTLPDTFTAYAMVRWATLPVSVQTVFAGAQATGYGSRVFRLSSQSAGAVEGAGYTGFSERTDTTGTAVANTWHVLAVVVTPSTVEAYLDGVSGGATSSAGQTSGRTSLALGSRWADLLSEQFVGYLRETRIYAAAHNSTAVGTVTTAMATLSNLPGPVAGVTGLQSWYAADVITGLVDTDPCASWADGSVWGRTAATAFSSDRPTYKTSQVNSLPVLRFDGSNDCLAGAEIVPGTFSLFAVLKPSGSGTRTIVGSNSANGTPQPQINSSGKLELVKSFTSVVGTGATTVSTSAFSVVGVTFASGSAWAVYVNSTTADASGSTATTMTTSSATTQLIGRRDTVEPFSGDLAELVVYNRVVNSTERGQVMHYLGTKYGITVS